MGLALDPCDRLLPSLVLDGKDPKELSLFVFELLLLLPDDDVAELELCPEDDVEEYDEDPDDDDDDDDELFEE